MHPTVMWLLAAAGAGVAAWAWAAIGLALMRARRAGTLAEPDRRSARR